MDSIFKFRLIETCFNWSINLSSRSGRLPSNGRNDLVFRAGRFNFHRSGRLERPARSKRVGTLAFQRPVQSCLPGGALQLSSFRSPGAPRPVKNTTPLTKNLFHHTPQSPYNYQHKSSLDHSRLRLPSNPYYKAYPF